MIINITGLQNSQGVAGGRGFMTKDKALHAWFNSFGIPFYPATSVPDKPGLPYGTYDLTTSAWNGGEVGLTVNLWYYTRSEEEPNMKAQELSEALGIGGAVIPCDKGYIWLKRGSPWCQSLRDEADINIKRRYINITAEYLTEN